MERNAHLETLQPYVKLHREAVAELKRRAAAIRALIEHPRGDDPKPPLPEEVLRADLGDVERILKKHQGIIGLAQDDRIGETLESVAREPELAREAAADPRAFAAQRGIELPGTLVVELRITGAGVSARFTNLDPDLPFDVGWSDAGFQAPAVVG